MSIKWITPAGNLGLITERVTFNLQLNVESETTVVFKLIAGNLPQGLRLLDSGKIVGSPIEVSKMTKSRFVVRASNNEDKKDRTFELSVDGADIPEWITKEGFLKVGAGNTFFVLDNAKVDFQLEATDADVIAGDILEYFLVPNGGELPPGLSLSRDGKISGFTDPVFAIDYGVNSDFGFDVNPFDINPLDFKEANTNGFDSFFYDQFTFDYNEPSNIPRRLSRIYNFIVAVSDGLHVVSRLFKIYVVTDEFLQADNTLIQSSTNVFTADNTADRIPIWITESDLGRVRADNYATIFLEVYRPPSLPGSVSFISLPDNIDGTPSEFPPGLEFDSTTGILAGRIPYQSNITKNYKFTIQAIFFPTIAETRAYNLKGVWQLGSIYKVNDIVKFGREVNDSGDVIKANNIYLCVKDHQTQSIENSEFWIKIASTIEKTFTISVFGEIESGIEWVSDSDLGTIKPNLPVELSIKATSFLYGGRVSYRLVSGALPPGLELISNGLIKGKAKQFADNEGPGLTRFFDTVNNSENFSILFDSGNTSFDRKFEFTILASDGINFSQTEKTFFFLVRSENEKIYANLYLKAFQSKENRLLWYSFITNSEIFSPEDLYRYGDPAFSVQTEIKILIYAGIESVEAEKYVQAMSRNHYRKRLLFGDVKTAVALSPDTQQPVYEVVYVDIVDEYEKNNVSISSTIKLPNDISSPVIVSYDAIKVDSDIPLVSDSDHQRVFPNSIKNMRTNLKEIGDRSREYLPLWMRSIQPNKSFETGFVKALVLCYTAPGKAEQIISKIKNTQFDFKQLDFVADRYLIDIIDGNIQDKYLAFPQRGEKLP